MQIRVSEQSISVKEMLINIVLITSCFDNLFFFMFHYLQDNLLILFESPNLVCRFGLF